MKRIRAGVFGAVVFAGSLAGIAALAQQDFSTVEIKAVPVAGKIHMLEGSGGNIGLFIGDDGVLMIDDQYAPLAEKIQAAITRLGAGKPRFVLNTHWHGDHTGGNAFFAEQGGTIIAHANVRQRMAKGQELLGRKVEPQSGPALPVLTYQDSVTLHINGESVLVQHLPKGHTDGDSVVFFPDSRVVHMGDLMFNGKFPFVDLDSGGDVEGYAANVETILTRLAPDTKLIPGHGPLASVADLKAFHTMLMESMAYVRAGIAAKKSVADMVAGAPESWKSWGDGFIKTDRWIETVHRSLTR